MEFADPADINEMVADSWSGVAEGIGSGTMVVPSKWRRRYVLVW